MVNVGDRVTVRSKANGTTKTGVVSRMEIKVKLDEPILIDTPWYQDTILEVSVPDKYEIVPSGGGRKTRKARKDKKGTRKSTRV